MEDEILNDEQFVIEEARHRELLVALNKLAEKIPTLDVDISPIEKQLVSLKDSLEKTLNKPKIETPKPEINIDVDLSSLEKTMLILVQEIRLLQEKVQSKPTKWGFDIDRNKITREINYVTAKAT